MLEVVGQDIISGNMGFIGTDPGREYQMGAAEKTEDITVTGNPAVLDNATGKPFKELHIYGRSEQMTTTGAQLLDFSDLIGKTETKNGATYKINEDQSITVSGTPTEYTSFYLKAMSLKAGSYYFLRNSDDKVFVQLISAKADMNNGFTLDEDADGIGVYVVFNVASNNTQSFNSTFTPMLNTGSTALPWEPYTGGKPSPSPDYPQEIVNAGEDGNLNVTVRGKNIFGGRYYYAIYSSGVLFIDKSQKDKEVKFPYQPETETRGICKALKCQKGKTYVISVTNPNKNATIGMAEYENIEKAFIYTNSVGSVTMTNKTKRLYTAKSDGILVCGIAGTWTDGKTTTHECTESELLQVEEASEATSYEPYHEPQPMSVTTPNGLPGIPVTSGGNYTDENGQQWVCDEVDLERGVNVQRVKVKELSADDKWTYRKLDSGNNNFQTRIYGEDSAKNSFPAICNILPYKNTIWNDDSKNLPKIYANNNEITISFPPSSEYSSLETFKQLLTNAKAFIFYCLATPIETPLTAAEISAYKSLRTYRGTTIVEAEDKAGISVTYKRNAKTDNISAEKKIEESEKKEYDES